MVRRSLLSEIGTFCEKVAVLGAGFRDFDVLSGEGPIGEGPMPVLFFGELQGLGAL